MPSGRGGGEGGGAGEAAAAAAERAKEASLRDNPLGHAGAGVTEPRRNQSGLGVVPTTLRVKPQRIAADQPTPLAGAVTDADARAATEEAVGRLEGRLGAQRAAGAKKETRAAKAAAETAGSGSCKAADDASASAAASSTAAAESVAEDADSLREAGGAAFRRGDAAAAEQLWGKALQLSPGDAALTPDARGSWSEPSWKLPIGDATLLSNRSAARLATGDARGALDDALAAVASAPAWPKARGRHAAALSALGRTEGALEACAAGLRLDPSAPYLRSEFARLKQRARAEGLPLPDVPLPPPPPGAAAAPAAATSGAAVAAGGGKAVTESTSPPAAATCAADQGFGGGGRGGGGGGGSGGGGGNGNGRESALGLGGVEYAREAVRLGRPETAVRILDREIGGASTDARLYLERCNALVSLGEHGRALEDAHTASYLAPKTPQGFLHKGNAQIALCDHDGAMATFQLGCVANPSDKELREAWFSAKEMCRTWRRAGKMALGGERARIQAFEAAREPCLSQVSGLARAEDRAAALKNLARVHVKWGRHTEARTLLDAAVREAPAGRRRVSCGQRRL